MLNASITAPVAHILLSLSTSNADGVEAVDSAAIDTSLVLFLIVMVVFLIVLTLAIFKRDR